MELVGIDVPIARLQQAFATSLWTHVSARAFYSRVFRNNDNDGNLVAELFVGENDYQEIMFDDRYDVQCFFDPASTVEDINPDLQSTRECGIVFVCKSPIIYPDVVTHRVTEELYRDVLAVIQDTTPLSVIPQSIVTGLPAYDDLNTEKLKAYNMQPWHVFRVNTDIKIEYGCDETVNTAGSYQYPFPIIFTG